MPLMKSAPPGFVEPIVSMATGITSCLDLIETLLQFWLTLWCTQSLTTVILYFMVYLNHQLFAFSVFKIPWHVLSVIFLNVALIQILFLKHFTGWQFLNASNIKLP